MFKKKPTIKTLSPLRSSDRRKTADRIIKDFDLQPQVPSDDDDGKDGATAAHSSLRKSLLPENCLSAKFSTTSGPDLKEVNGIVYVGSHGAGEQRVLWVQLRDRLYPSVYTLWHYPGIIPLIHTPSLVVRKLKGGADLMTPGLAGPPFPTQAKKNSVVAIANLENPSVPVVVGTCVIDVSGLTETQGAKGHAVETFHWAGDELWNWSTSGKSGIDPPAEIAQWMQGGPDVLAGETQALSLEDQVDAGRDGGGGGVSISTDAERPDRTPEHSGYVSGEDLLAENAPGEGDGSISTQEIDEAFRRAFLYGVYQYKEQNKNDAKHGLVFPLSQSQFVSALVQPFLPVFTKQQQQSFVMKKTSWKNARKFIMALHKNKLLLAKEFKNEAMVLDVDFDDASFRDFQPYALPEKEASDERKAAKGNAADGDGADDSVGQQLKIVNLYRPKDSLLPLFENSESGRQSYYAPSDIRQNITNYVTSEKLVSQSNKRLITLDPVISNAVLDSSVRTDAEALNKGCIPRDVLIDRVISLCNPFHAILRNGEKVSSLSSQKPSMRPKAGPAPKIGIIMETRSGNKTATRVHNLEAFFLNPQALADELRKSCAGSTSVEPFRAGKGMEVMVQGPQRDAVIKALEKRGIAKGWVDVTDKTKGKKK